MNRRLVIGVLLLTLLVVKSLSAQEQLISPHYKNISFREYCQRISLETKVPIYYSSNEFKYKIISIQKASISILDAIKGVINTDSFNVLSWNDAVIILKDHNFPYKLALVKTEIPQKETITNAMTSKITTTLAAARKQIVVGKKGYASHNSMVDVGVTIYNADDKKPLPGATVYIVDLQKGTISNKNGEADILLQPGKYTLKILYMGMKTQLYKLIVRSTGHFNIYMQKQGIELSSVNVYGDNQMNMRQKDPGLEKMTVKSIREIPVMIGEPDIVKAAAMLPGIVSVGDGTSGLNVRGGSSDQNAFYLNKIPIFNTSHLFGFFPAFNADLVKNFTVYKGYIPARYGGRLSSVFDIETRNGNPKKFSLHGGLSPVAINGVMSIPILKDKLNFIFSGRRSYSDWILRRIDDPAINRSSASFNDISAGLSLDLPKLHLSAFVYHSHDRFAYGYVNEFQYDNNGFSLIAKQNYSNKIKATYSLVSSQYDNKVRNYANSSTAYSHLYVLKQNEFKANFDYLQNSFNTLHFGYDLNFYDLNRGIVEPIGYSLRIPLNLGRNKGLENAVFVSDHYRPWQWLDFTAGFRLNVFNPLGPQTTYNYQQGKPLNDLYISDTLVFNNNMPIKTFVIPEFRFAAKMDLGKLSSLKVAFTQMHQNLFRLNTTFSISPTSQWKMADYHLNPSKSNQVSMGYFYNFVKQGFESSVEVYYKKTKDYTEFKDGANFLQSKNIEQSVLQGKQWSYGLEMMLRRRGDYRFTGWIAYTYSRSFVQINGAADWEKINQGKVYPSSFDIPNVLSALVNIKLSKRLSFSTTVNYQSGRPITYPVSIYYVNKIPFVDYSSRNAYRIPAYFRMDASFTIEGNLKRNKFMHSSLVLSVYNLTGRDNPYSVYFVPSSTGVRTFQYSVIAVPIFTATWIFKLGNFYAN